MPETTTIDVDLVRLTSYCLAFSRLRGEGYPVEKAADAARDEAKAAVEGAAAFIAEG